ncbi:hypothetical protein [Vibrio sp. TRT 1302]|uniref:hypothetical protein n=1 Tax=Vibrio sp. TRT 1302 TaxID=3418504 RepID=UPI003CF361CF
MGTISFFSEQVDSEEGSNFIEVKDCIAKPMIDVTDGEFGQLLNRVSFDDWEQFERFVDSINSLHDRLKGMHK